MSPDPSVGTQHSKDHLLRKIVKLYSPLNLRGTTKHDPVSRGSNSRTGASPSFGFSTDLRV